MIGELTSTISISDAARRAGMTPNGLRYWLEREQVETIKTPLGRVIVQESLEAFLRNRTQREIEIPAGL